MPEILTGSKESSLGMLKHSQIMSLASEYEKRYPETMEILDITGVSPFGSREMMNPYIGVLDTEDFSNVGRHCVSVANAVEKIVNTLGFSNEEKDRAIENALLHDGDKRLEVMRKKAAKFGATDNQGKPIDVYGESGYATIGKVFSDVGVNPAILDRIKSMGGMTGHNSLKDFALIQDGSILLNPERTLTDMIVHIGDDMTYSSFGIGEETTAYVSFEQRSLLSNFAEKYGFLWKEGFGGYHFYDLQKITFQMICSHMQKLIDPMSAIDSVEFIVGLANRKTSDVQDGVSQRIGDVL